MRLERRRGLVQHCRVTRADIVLVEVEVHAARHNLLLGWRRRRRGWRRWWRGRRRRWRWRYDRIAYVMASECTQAGPDGGAAQSEGDSIFMVASILIYCCPNAGSRPGTNDTSDQGACSPLPRLAQIGAPDKE